MVRIMTADELTSTTITVDGTLSGEGIEPVQTCCSQALSKGKSVRLYLRHVSAIDDRARTMLRHLAAEGVDLKANGIYSSYIVDDIQSAGLSKRRSSQ
jgi:hypothetical protein